MAIAASTKVKVLACCRYGRRSCICFVFLLPGMIRCGVVFNSGQNSADQHGTK